MGGKSNEESVLEAEKQDTKRSIGSPPSPLKSTW